MDIDEVKKAYDKCIKLLHKKTKTIPYHELDQCLYVVARYIKWMEEE